MVAIANKLQPDYVGLRMRVATLSKYHRQVGLLHKFYILLTSLISNSGLLYFPTSPNKKESISNIIVMAVTLPINIARLMFNIHEFELEAYENNRMR